MLRILLLLLLRFTNAVQLTSVANQPCTSNKSKEWTQALPWFSSESDLTKSPQWRKYVELVYGPELIGLVFPLDFKRIQFFYTDYLDKAGLGDYPAGCEDGVKTFGDKGIAAGDVYHGIFGPRSVFTQYLLVYLPSPHAARDHSRVEVLHGRVENFRKNFLRFERSYWMYKFSGTGIFYDLGHSVRAADHDAFPVPMVGTDPVPDTERMFPYDSVQYYARTEFNTQVYEIVDLRSIALRGTVSYVCPLAREAFFSKGAQCICDERHSWQVLNCK